MANSLNRNNNTNSYVGIQSKIKSIPSLAEIDRVNVYEFENGMDVELTNMGGEITSENIKKAQAKVLKNLKKDPAYYTNQLAEESIKLVGAYGSGKKPGNQTKESAEKVKAEVNGPKDETPGKDKANELKTVGKVEKANVSKDKKPTNSNTVTKAKQETYTAKKAKGIKSTMDLPGKEKKININENKEYQGISDEQKAKLEKTIEYLKQQGKNEMANALERLIKSGIKDLDEKLQKYPKAVAKINQLIDMIDEDKFDDKITNLKKYTYTLNGKKVTPEIGYFDHSLKAMISTPRSGDEYFDYEFYRIGEPDESGNIELSPEKGKKGMYTEEMNTSGFKSGIKDLDEKLRKNAPVSKYVSDFEKSDAPQFKGKSSKERRNMAVAAYAEKNPGKLKEETSSYPMPIEWVKQHYRVEKSPEGIKIFRKSDNKEVSLYDVGEHYEEFQASAYDMDTRDNSGIIKSTMQRQVSQPIKSFDQIVKGLNKESKIKLTKENLNMIQEMVIEAVNAYQATGRTGKTTVITADNKTKTDLTNAGVKLTDF
jgi:tetratricopeptide (TPR) repeat protein